MKKKSTLFIFLIFLLTEFNISAQSNKKVYKNSVTASYYAEDFHGKKTSNGEIFNMYDLTCAHKSLPFNTILKVTNLKNGKHVNVRVNDRGPFYPDREIDLSKAAAVKLGMIKTGTTKVRLEIVKMGPNTKASVQTAKKAALMMKQRFPNYKADSHKNKKIIQREQGTFWNVKVATFSNKENATALARKLKHQNIEGIVLKTSKKTGNVSVELKNVPAKKLPEIEQKLQQMDFWDYIIKQSDIQK